MSGLPSFRGYNSRPGRRGDRSISAVVREQTRVAMTGEEGHSITGWLGELREGDQAAAQPLWERYFA